MSEEAASAPPDVPDRLLHHEPGRGEKAVKDAKTPVFRPWKAGAEVFSVSEAPTSYGSSGA